jgi:hypothetical protein
LRTRSSSWLNPSTFTIAPAGDTTIRTGWPISARYAADIASAIGLPLASAPAASLSNWIVPVGKRISTRTDSMTCRSVALPSGATSSTTVRNTCVIVCSSDPPAPGCPAEIVVLVCCVVRVRQSLPAVQW